MICYDYILIAIRFIDALFRIQSDTAWLSFSMPVLIGDGFVQKLAQRAPSICEIVDQQSVSWNRGFHLCGLTLGSWTHGPPPFFGGLQKRFWSFAPHFSGDVIDTCV